MTRTTQVLAGCAVGCAILLLAAVGACVGFVAWLKRPGELLEPGVLLDQSTLAHVEWTLRLEDPGTEQAFRAVLEAVNDTRPVVPILPDAIQRLSRQRDEREMRQFFPLVATWSLRRGAAGAHDHLFGASVPNLGNWILIADWFLGFTAGRDGDLEQIEHLGEQIYRMRKTDAAFFIRRNGVFITTDVERARSTVEALERREPAAAAPEELRRLLDGLPGTVALRGAAVNEAGACATILAWLTGDPVEDIDLSTVRALTLAGGFTPGAGFEATLTVLSDDPRWGASHADRLAAALAARLGEEVTAVEPAADPLALRISVDDPAGAVRRRLDFLLTRPAPAARE